MDALCECFRRQLPDPARRAPAALLASALERRIKSPPRSLAQAALSECCCNCVRDVQQCESHASEKTVKNCHTLLPRLLTLVPRSASVCQ